jgi:hypothetical protein
MTSWVDRYRSTVSWGDEITADTIAGVPCCWVEASGQRVYFTAGTVADLHGALAQALTVQRNTQSHGQVLFVDEHATAYQVEEAMHAMADAGIGCGFIEAEPSVHQHALLDRCSEGTLLPSLLNQP